ncbi:MAG: hypothetical protein ABI633_06560 [Burkholderiales bacterium]
MKRDVNETNAAVERAFSGAHQAIDKVSGALRPGVEHLAKDAHQAVGRFGGAASRPKEMLLVGGRQLKDAQARFSVDRRSQIRESPTAWVALAFGLPRLLSGESHGIASGDAAVRTTGAGMAPDQDNHSFAEAVDRLTRALQTGSFDASADSEPG